MQFFLEPLEGNNFSSTLFYSVSIYFQKILMCEYSLFVYLFGGSRYKWDSNEKHLKPETGLLQLRSGLKVFANLRPASVLPQVMFVIMQ